MHAKFRFYSGLLKALLCVLLLSASTYAWFTTTRSKQTANQVIDIAGSGMTIQGFAAFMDGERVQDYTTEVINMRPFDLEEYDAIFDQNNQLRQPLLLRIILDAPPSGAGTLNISYTCTETDPYEAKTSNIIRFCAATEYQINAYLEAQGSSTLISEAAIIDAAYNSATVAEQVSTVCRYLTDDSYSHKKTFSRVVTSSSTSTLQKYTSAEDNLALLDGEIGQDCVVYLLFDYEPDFIRLTHPTSLTSHSEDGKTVLEYASDLGTITFTYRGS